jgi:hypothetical protein
MIIGKIGNDAMTEGDQDMMNNSELWLIMDYHENTDSTRQHLPILK